MTKNLYALILLFIVCSTSAQTVYVLDKVTQQGIPGVLVYASKSKQSAHTNAKGQFSLAAFELTDSIYFKTPGYSGVVYSVEDIIARKFKVEMSEVPVSLGEVIVSFNRWEGNKIEAPNRIENISMKEVAFQNPQTTADMLGTSGYAFIQKSQLGGGSPMLRGMATNRVLLVVDGVRMNNAVFRAGNLQNVISLDPNALESTEILFGPGCVMYGSDAIGGVMDFHTLTPRMADTSNNGLLVFGNAMMRTSTANSEKTAHVDFNIAFKKWSFVTSFTRAEYGDLRSGTVGGVNSFYRQFYVQTISDKDYMVPNEDSSLQVGSRYSQDNFMQKVRFTPNNNWDFDYSFHYSQTSPYNRYDRLYVMQTAGPYKNKLRWAEWYYGPQRWNMHRIGITHSRKNIAYDHLRVIGALQYFEESRYDREFMVRELRMQKETVHALSFNLDLDKSFSEKATLFYGLEVVHNTVGSYANLTHVITNKVDSTVTRYPNGSTWESYGAYLNLKYKLSEKIILNTGARCTYYRIKAVFDTTLFPFPFTNTEMKNGTLNGSIGLVYAPTDNWQLYVNGATGFRAPNIDDMGKVFESTPGYLIVPNPTLKPEHVYNAEAGTVKSFGSFVKFDCAAYYTLLSDGMERKDYTFNGQNTIRYLGNSSRIQAVQNITKIRVYGFQAGLEINYKGFGLRSTISYQKGEEQSPDSLIYYPLRHAAPTFGSTHLTYQRKKLQFDFYTIYNDDLRYEELALTERVNPSYARDYSRSSQGEAYVAGWVTYNFKAAFFVNQNVALMFGIENIGDRLYRPYSSGINAAGRNFIATIRARF